MPPAHPDNPVHESADFAAVPPTAPPEVASLSRAAAPRNKEDFARVWEFASFLEMFEASQPAGAAGGGKKWLLTALRGGKWLLWNDDETESAQEFDSREAALSNLSR